MRKRGARYTLLYQKLIFVKQKFRMCRKFAVAGERKLFLYQRRRRENDARRRVRPAACDVSITNLLRIHAALGRQHCESYWAV